MSFEKVVYLVAVLVGAGVFGFICFLAGQLRGERTAEKKKPLDTFIVQHSPVKKVRLCASIIVPDCVDEVSRRNAEKALAEKLALQLPDVWLLEKEIKYDTNWPDIFRVKYTAHITVLPEGET